MWLYCVAKTIDRLTGWLASFAALCMVMACVLCVGNALSRYVFHVASNFYLELQWYFFGAMFMLASAHVLKNNGHVRVDIVYAALSERGKLWVELFGLCFFLLPMCAIAGFLTWEFFLQSFRFGEHSGNAVGLLRWPAKILFPLGFGTLCLQGLSEICKIILVLQGKIADRDGYEKPLQ